MKIINRLDISGFRGIQHSSFKDFNHVNVIVGPNNSGKTSLLMAIHALSSLNKNSNDYCPCTTCQEFARRERETISTYKWSVDPQNIFEGKTMPKFSFCFNDEYLEENSEYHKSMENIDSILNSHISIQHMQGRSITKDAIDKLRKHIEDECCNKIDLIVQSNGQPISQHMILIPPDSITKLSKGILLCPEERLQSYKQKDISDYVKGKDMDAILLGTLQGLIRDVVDSKLVNYKVNTLNYLRGPNKYSTSIKVQGSGVRSLICLISDILSSDEQIVLIDEPELGLNPAAKKKFISFLKYQAKDKQFFITTHDPTFVNPKLWGNDILSLYSFSIVENEFVKVSLDHNSHDPNTFGGYLPHTNCIKDFHVYVEGTFDVYIHQEFFKRFIDKVSNQLRPQIGRADLTFYQILNRVEFYHLGGDFWKHLLHTIPQKPYSALLIFDGDKKDNVKCMIERYTKNRLVNLPSFKFVEQTDFSNMVFSEDIPVYALSKDNIEQYLEPIPTKDNKADGPSIAKKMTGIPEEFELIYLKILKTISPVLSSAYLKTTG